MKSREVVKVTVWKGNWMWIWVAGDIYGGDPVAIANAAKELGLAGVLVKAHDGTRVWSQWGRLVGPLKEQGLKVAAWGYVYGRDPEGEAFAARKVIEQGADLYVIDAEAEFESTYGETAAQRFLSVLRSGLNVPLGLSSFAFPSYHGRFPWKVFAENVDVMLPQVYWYTIGMSVDEAWERSFSEYAKFGKPIAPVGQAYDVVSPEDMWRFAALVKGAGCAGISWWSWQHATPEMWAVIRRCSSLFAMRDYEGSYFEKDIEAAKKLGFMYGDSENVFRPKDTVLREELAAVSVRIWNKVCDLLEEVLEELKALVAQKKV